MDDLNEAIGQILSDPEKMRQLQNVAVMMGLGGGQNSPPPKASSVSEKAEEPELFSKLAPLLGTVGGENETTAFLRALRPLLSKERQEKLDGAMRILRVLRILPLLKDKGFLPMLL